MGQIRKWTASVAAAAVLAGGAGAMGAAPTDQSPPANRSIITAPFNAASLPADQRAAAALGHVVSRAGQFTVISDTGHGNMDLMEFMADDKTMAALARSGVKNLFLEVRPEFQGIADAAAAGKISPRQYATERLRIIEESGVKFYAPKDRDTLEGAVMAAAGRHGIKVWCAERQAASLPGHDRISRDLSLAEMRLQEALERKADHDSGFMESLRLRGSTFLNLVSGGHLAEDAGQEAMKQLMAPYASRADTRINRLADQRDTLLETRIRADKKVAAFVREKAGREKSVVFYGAGHGRMACDLDDHLKAARVEIYSDMTDARAAFQLNAMAGFNFAPYALDLSNGRLLTAAESRALVKPAPTLPAAWRPNACQ